MVRRIAIAVDGSSFSKYAIEYYLQFIARPDDLVGFINCIAPFFVFGSVGNDKEFEQTTKAMEKLEQEESDKFLQDSAALLAPRNIKHENVVVRGYPREEIPDAADRFEAQMLIVGSRGMTGVSRILVGSVADATVHHTGCSVLVVHPPRIKETK